MKTDDSYENLCSCGRSYKTKGSLNSHRRWECGKNPSFKCPYCSYCAKHRFLMKRHVINVHNKKFLKYYDYSNPICRNNRNT